MGRTARLLAYGSAGAIVLAGAIVAVALGGTTAQIAAIVLVTVGLGAALLLVFFEIGLSEDRARAADSARRGRPPRPHPGPARPQRRRRWPRRPH